MSVDSASGSNADDKSGFLPVWLGYFRGSWLAQDEIGLGIDDLGFRQGVTVVERLRTYQGRLFAVDPHLDRWQQSLDALAIVGVPPRGRIVELLTELLVRNKDRIDVVGDIGITLFATPGIASEESCSLGMHLNLLNQQHIERRCRNGQRIVVTEVQQPAAACWPRSVKVRSRIHYYLADLAARRVDPEAVGVLVDHDGSVTETQIANIAIVESGRIVSPLSDQVLPGITQRLIEQIADLASLRWDKQRITANRLATADEVLLMGTDTGLWFANRVGSDLIGNGTPGPMFTELLARFHRLTLS